MVESGTNRSRRATAQIYFFKKCSNDEAHEDFIEEALNQALENERRQFGLGIDDFHGQPHLQGVL